MGVDYELIHATLCTCHTLVRVTQVGFGKWAIYYIILLKNPWVSADVHTLAKKLF